MVVLYYVLVVKVMIETGGGRGMIIEIETKIGVETIERGIETEIKTETERGGEEGVEVGEFLYHTYSDGLVQG